MESVNLDEEEAEERRAEARDSPERQRAEQVPQGPVFDISVGDPHKVGDLTSAHTVYQVRTKVGFALLYSTVSPLCIVKARLMRIPGGVDNLESIPQQRVHRVPPLPRLPLALQRVDQQQPRCGCATAAGETGGWPLRRQFRRE